MTRLVWTLIIGVVVWLTGKFIGDHGYGTALGGSASDWLEFVIGVAGGSFGGYQFLQAGIGNDRVLGGYAAAVVGSVALVFFARQLFARCLPSTGVK